MIGLFWVLHKKTSSITLMYNMCVSEVFEVDNDNENLPVVCEFHTHIFITKRPHQK